jgi:hypothetical protein
VLADPEGEAEFVDVAAGEAIGDLTCGEVFAGRACGQRRRDPGTRAEKQPRGGAKVAGGVGHRAETKTHVELLGAREITRRARRFDSSIVAGLGALHHRLLWSRSPGASEDTCRRPCLAIMSAPSRPSLSRSPDGDSA